MKKGRIAMVSMQDIADKAGVSRVTVSRVLSDHPSVKAETRQKVLIGQIKRMNEKNTHFYAFFVIFYQ